MHAIARPAMHMPALHSSSLTHPSSVAIAEPVNRDRANDVCYGHSECTLTITIVTSPRRRIIPHLTHTLRLYFPSIPYFNPSHPYLQVLETPWSAPWCGLCARAARWGRRFRRGLVVGAACATACAWGVTGRIEMMMQTIDDGGGGGGGGGDHDVGDVMCALPAACSIVAP